MSKAKSSGSSKHDTTHPLGFLGPINDPTHFGPCSVRDRILSDMTSLYPDALTAPSTVSMGCIGAVRANPFAYLTNLVMVQAALAEDELTAFGRAGGRVICETTPRGQGRDHSALFKLAQELQPRGVNFIIGSGWSSETHDSDPHMSPTDLQQDMLRDVVVGVTLVNSTDDTKKGRASKSEVASSSKPHTARASTIGRCGLIGEIALMCKGNKLSQTEQQVLVCAAGVHVNTGAPILVAMAPTQDVSLIAAHAVVRMLIEKHKVIPSKLCVAGCFSVGSSNDKGSTPRTSLYASLHTSLVKLLQVGVLLGVDVGDAGLPVHMAASSDTTSRRSSRKGTTPSTLGSNIPNEVDFVTIEQEEVAALVAQLCAEGWSSQLMLANNIRFKHQLRTFGGEGYSCAVDGFTTRLMRHGLNSDGVKMLVQGNAYTWLSWYAPPKPKARAALPPWKCDGPCGKEYKAKKEPFTRMDFRYCSTKCMRAHKEELDEKEGGGGGVHGDGGGGGRGRAGNSSAWGISVGSG